MRYSTTVGVDLAKNVIQVSVVNGRGKELSNRSLSRKKFAKFLCKQKPSLVAFESCATAHYWARAAERHGHEARIIPAKAVAPFRQGHKTDSNDALAEQQRRQGQHRWLKQESRQQPTSIGTDSRRSCLYLPDERAQGLEGQMATSDRRTQRCEPSGDCTGQQECKNRLGDGNPGN